MFEILYYIIFLNISEVSIYNCLTGFNNLIEHNQSLVEKSNRSERFIQLLVELIKSDNLQIY